MSIFKIAFYCLISLLFFTYLACTASKTPINEPIDETVDNRKIMVLLQKQVRATALEEEFKAYELKSKGLMSRRENRCMFTYNPTLIDGTQLLEMVKKSDNVLEAKFPEVTRQPKVTN